MAINKSFIGTIPKGTDIIKQVEPSILESLYFKGQQLITYGGSGTAGADTLIYIVPAGYTFYLTNISVSAQSDDAANAIEFIVYLSPSPLGASSSQRLLTLWLPEGVTMHGDKDITYTNPIRLPERMGIRTYSGVGSAAAVAHIIGFLVPNTLNK